jgi:siroheme synthase-like protein
MNESQNPLYPIFLKLHQLNMLIVGAGEVGYEKLSFILKSSPDARITIVAPEVSGQIREELLKYPDHKVRILQKPFEPTDLPGHDLIIAATNIKALNRQVQQEAKKHQKLINVADTPDLCDFYLGSIVTRGDLKVAISTNGKSPTLAKRFRQLLEAILPKEANDLLTNLHQIRNQLEVGFTQKVKKLNALTATLVTDKEKIRQLPACEECPYKPN